jgi:hypothetical protein
MKLAARRHSTPSGIGESNQWLSMMITPSDAQVVTAI